MAVFICQGCSTCWQCVDKRNDDEITIGQPTKELLEVGFESANAQKLFFNAMCKKLRKAGKHPRIEGLTLYFPHMMFWNEGDIELVSQNTIINEHLRSCDTDGNLFITDKEAKIYHDAAKPEQKNEN